MLDKLLDHLFELLSKSKDIINIFDNLSNRKQLQLERYAKEDIVTLKVKTIAQEELDAKAFWDLTRINTNKFLREKIIKLYEEAEGRLTYPDFREAHRHGFLKIDSNGELTIKRVSFYDKLFYYFFVIFSFLFSIFGCLFLMYMFLKISNPSELKLGIISTYSPSPETSEINLKLVFLMYGAFFLVLAFLLILPTYPLRSAKKLKAEIRQQLSKKEQLNRRKINNLSLKKIMNLFKNNLNFINHTFKEKNKK